MRLKDKVAIITGAGRGIGRAYALRFTEEAAKVAICDIDVSALDKVANEIEAKGGEVLAVRTDVSDEASVGELVKKTMERFGKIDILINNAAIYYGIGFKPWDSWTTEDWERIFAVNVRGSWLCTKLVVPHMMARGTGKIIYVASTTTDTGVSVILPYTCSKGAIIALTRAMARALGRYGINVNCISPGYTMTEATLEMPGRDSRADEVQLRGRCFRRHEYPEDLVGTAVFLASDDSAFITGQTIVVDGGEVMR